MAGNERRPGLRSRLVAVAVSSVLLTAACSGNGNLGNNNSNGNGSGGQRSTNSGAATEISRDVLRNPIAFGGRQVTVTGKVGKVAGQNAFTLTPPGKAQHANIEPLLVIEQEPTDVKAGEPVEVVGPVITRFQIPKAQSFATGTLDNAALAKYLGQPYLQALYLGPVSANLGGNGQAADRDVGGVGGGSAFNGGPGQR